MRIGLNMASLRGCGSSAVGRNIWREFSALASEHELLAWVSDSWAEEARQDGADHTQVLAARTGSWNKLWTENVQIRRAIRRSHIDKLFSLGDTSLPHARVPHLLFVQLAYLAIPASSWDFPTSLAFRLKMKLLRTYFRAALPSINRFTVQTQFMKTGLVDQWGIPPERVEVVPSSVEAWIVGLERTRNPEPYICYVSASAPQKNHVVLAGVMAALTQRWPDLRCKVTVSRKNVPALVDEATRLGVVSLFDFEGQVAHRKAIDLLRGAEAAVIPSQVESFGLPYYEAMAVGCPVVAADLPFAREACGSAGLYAEPRDSAAFATHVDHLLQSTELMAETSEQVRKQFQAVYTPWRDIAAAYWTTLEEL
jgi:glycosyltransferase involved in cell wall biosynthesis